MLDVKFIRENAERVERDAKNKGYKIDIKDVLRLDDERRKLQLSTDELRAKRNETAAKMKGGRPSPELIAEGKALKEKLSKNEGKLKEIEEKFDTEMRSIPNILLPDVPLGPEENYEVVAEWEPKSGKKTAAEDHLDFAVKRDWVDFERGAKVAGTKFYFLRGELALLENAIYQFALAKLTGEKHFTFMTVPHMVSGAVAFGTGFAPRTSDQSDEYFIEGEDLSLIATAEMSLTGYHKDEILDEKDLPLFYAGYSPCYRKEAGAAGKHTRGLFRVHQFNKLEMYSYCLPEDSEKIHEKLRGIEEEIWRELGIPYRVISVASGDLGAPAAKKYDLEYWSPVDGSYRELTSCSNCTDYQARNLNIRVRRKDGLITTAHTLNGTAVSLARSLVAVIENYQSADGEHLEVPEVLRKYLGGREEL
jgi:seryl-tRNA synthetase